VHDVYHGPRGVLRGAQAAVDVTGFDPAFVANVTRSAHVPANYMNAASVVR
jgi:hypothetical protein